MEIRPCFSSVWRRRLKFSTLPSAVNLDGNKDGDNPSFRFRFPRFFSTSSINQHVEQLSWELMRLEPPSQILSCYINDGQDTLRDPRNRPDPERPARSQRPSMERPCSWPNPEKKRLKSSTANRLGHQSNTSCSYCSSPLLVHSVTCSSLMLNEKRPRRCP